MARSSRSWPTSWEVHSQDLVRFAELAKKSLKRFGQQSRASIIEMTSIAIGKPSLDVVNAGLAVRGTKHVESGIKMEIALASGEGIQRGSNLRHCLNQITSLRRKITVRRNRWPKPSLLAILCCEARIGNLKKGKWHHNDNLNSLQVRLGCIHSQFMDPGLQGKCFFVFNFITITGNHAECRA